MNSDKRHKIFNLLCVIIGQADLIPIAEDFQKCLMKAEKIAAAAKELNGIIRESNFPFSVYTSHIDAFEDAIGALNSNLRVQMVPEQRRFLGLLISNIERKIEFLRQLRPNQERVCFRCNSNMIIDIKEDKFKCLECKAVWVINK